MAWLRSGVTDGDGPNFAGSTRHVMNFAGEGCRDRMRAEQIAAGDRLDRRLCARTADARRKLRSDPDRGVGRGLRSARHHLPQQQPCRCRRSDTQRPRTRPPLLLRLRLFSRQPGVRCAAGPHLPRFRRARCQGNHLADRRLAKKICNQASKPTSPRSPATGVMAEPPAAQQQSSSSIWPAPIAKGEFGNSGDRS